MWAAPLLIPVYSTFSCSLTVVPADNCTCPSAFSCWHLCHCICYLCLRTMSATFRFHGCQHPSFLRAFRACRDTGGPVLVTRWQARLRNLHAVRIASNGLHHSVNHRPAGAPVLPLLYDGLRSTPLRFAHSSISQHRHLLLCTCFALTSVLPYICEDCATVQ